MSSILTALKKLEDKDFHKEEIRVLFPKESFRHKKARESFMGFFSGMNIWLSIIFVALVSLMGMLSWNKLNTEKNVSYEKSQSSKLSPQSAVLSNIPEAISKPPLPENVPKDNIPIPREIDLMIPETKRPKAFSKPEMVGENKTSESFRVSKSFKIPGRNNTAEKTQVEGSPPQKGETYLNEPFETANTQPPSGQENFALQAIAWAREPANRMAVINGKILRQGDMLNGTLLNQINVNDVVLKKDGYTWRVMFNVR